MEIEINNVKNLQKRSFSSMSLSSQESLTCQNNEQEVINDNIQKKRHLLLQANDLAGAWNAQENSLALNSMVNGKKVLASSNKHNIEYNHKRNPLMFITPNGKDENPKEKFQWTMCSEIFKAHMKKLDNPNDIDCSTNHENNETEQLKQNITFESDDMSFTICKPLMHDDKLGWNWHKCWNLPKINVKFQDIQKLNNWMMVNTSPIKLRAEITAIKTILSQTGEILRLVPIKLIGTTIKDFSHGRCMFSGIKFSSTSFNNDGLKFYLVISIKRYFETKKTQDEKPQEEIIKQCNHLIQSYLSPPIFVDARRASRDSNAIKKRKILMKYLEIFPLRLISNSMNQNTHQSLKNDEDNNNNNNNSNERALDPNRSNNIQILDDIENEKMEEEGKIQNNIQGLCDYLTAQNIKNKIKHPLYLLFKFSNCMKLYYNQKTLTSLRFFQGLEENIIWQLQLILFSIGQKLMNNLSENYECTNMKSKALEDKDFIFYIENSNETNSFYTTKTISEYFRPINHEHMHFTLNPKTIPTNFIEIQIDKLKKAYETIYSFVSRFKGKANLNALLDNTNRRGSVSDLSIHPNSEGMYRDFDDFQKKSLLNKQNITDFANLNIRRQCNTKNTTPSVFHLNQITDDGASSCNNNNNNNNEFAHSENWTQSSSVSESLDPKNAVTNPKTFQNKDISTQLMNQIPLSDQLAMIKPLTLIKNLTKENDGNNDKICNDNNPNQGYMHQTDPNILVHPPIIEDEKKYQDMNSIIENPVNDHKQPDDEIIKVTPVKPITSNNLKPIPLITLNNITHYPYIPVTCMQNAQTLQNNIPTLKAQNLNDLVRNQIILQNTIQANLLRQNNLHHPYNLMFDMLSLATGAKLLNPLMFRNGFENRIPLLAPTLNPQMPTNTLNLEPLLTNLILNNNLAVQTQTHQYLDPAHVLNIMKDNLNPSLQTGLKVLQHQSQPKPDGNQSQNENKKKERF